MKRIPMKFKTEELCEELRLSTRRDNFDNIYHCVDFVNNIGKSDYVMFAHLSSALDFIYSNFK